MCEAPKLEDDGLPGKARRLARRAWGYARSEEAKAKVSVAKEKAVEVGGAATAGAKSLISKSVEVASQAKERANEFTNSEKARRVRTEARGLWERSRAFEVRDVPWMESPYVIGALLVFLFPLGLWLVWKHPAWGRPRKFVWVGAWAGLMMIGFFSSRQGNGPATVTPAEAGLAPTGSSRSSGKSSRSSPSRADTATRIADLAEAEPSQLTPVNVLAALETTASRIEPFDVRAIDYTHGPNGEAIISRPGRDTQTGKETTDSGYLAADGRFRLHGLRTSWYDPATPGGERKKFQEIHYFDGQAHGTVRNWYETGEKQSEMTMRRGRRHGLATSFLRDGTVVHVSLWEDGTANGPQCDWYGSGGIKALKNYKRNAAHGVKKSWHQDGKPESEGHYSDGQLDGELREWSPKGKLVKTLWKQGEVRFLPGAANKRAFYYKLNAVADLHDPDSTNFEFKSPVDFLGAFGRPQRGSLDFDPETSDPASPRIWGYRCSDGNLDLRVVYIIPQRSFHVLINPDDTME